MMLTREISQRRLLWILILGFGLVVLLLVAAGFMSVQSVRLIRESSGSLVSEQLLTTRLTQELQREQQTLSAVFYNLARAQQRVDSNEILRELKESDVAIQQIIHDSRGTWEEPLWREMAGASSQFAKEVRRVLKLQDPDIFASENLLLQHQQAMSLTAQLLSDGYQKATEAQRNIEERSSELGRESLLLLGASLLLALACAVLTVRVTHDLSRRMESQANELSRVSWQMLEAQESVARRFSHELHDELGQSLTAVKANLMALEGSGEADQSRIQDTRELVDEAVQNVRELSQLLRPVILDDFGLDAALRFLTERFEERTGIEVDHQTDFEGRLADETETHLFRIAQEALTNVARHSGAKHVWIRLRADEDKLKLSIRDDGQGLQPNQKDGRRGLGMVGMRARARSMGGELKVESQKGAGVTVEVWVPMQSNRVAQSVENDTHLVS
jgi:signal transduction histidine kinase